MNNILSFNEYSDQELERVVYDNELNEGSITGKGLRGFFNRRAARSVRQELSEEIEMSKTIMDGITASLETLNDNFEIIKKNMDNDKDDEVNSEKRKALKTITDILEKSKENTWDINQLIDEGEIDYTGFTANVGIASVSFFGILFAPFRSVVMIHKGYNYFFTLVKNTIRKALVMLQLNFDQFENIIIQKGFQSDEYQREIETAVEIESYLKDVEAELVKGNITSKKADEYSRRFQIAKERTKQKRDSNKAIQQSGNVFNCLNDYNNTYTRSLETLRQYTQEDVQKHLDAIKTSMNKLAGPDVDLQTFGELVIAAAEEHAYKVSSSIYNKFAKMTEVFSLPNQAKLIKLIDAASKEELEEVKKRSEKKKKELSESEKAKKLEKIEEEGSEIFTSTDGVNNAILGDFDKESSKYDESGTRGSEWTYEEFKKLSPEKQDIFSKWLYKHPEVLKKCHKTLQMATVTTDPKLSSYIEYIDYIVDYIGDNLGSKTIRESLIMNYTEYLFERESLTERKARWRKKVEDNKNNKYEDLLKAIMQDDEGNEINIYTRSGKDEVEYIITLLNGYAKKKYDDWITRLERLLKSINERLTAKEKSSKDKKAKKEKEREEKEKTEKDEKKNFYLNLGDLNEHEIDTLKEGFEDEEVASTAFEVIGHDYLNDNTFVKNAGNMVKTIKECLNDDKKKVNISSVQYHLLSDAAKVLKPVQDNDYAVPNKDNK